MKNKSFNIIAFLALILVTTLSGCTKDLYDSEYEGNKTDNPLGLAAPDNFKWSSLSTAKIVLTVNDRFLGKYGYLLEIYDSNPLYTDNTHLLGVGIAKEGQPYTGEISYPQTTGRIFVKQTDPRGRVTVKSFAASQDGGTINADFNSFADEGMTRAKPGSGFPDVPEYNYTATDIPSNAEEIRGDSQDDWLDKKNTSNFKITGNYNGGIYHNGSKDGLKLFVSGTWTLSGNTTGNWKYSIEKGLDVIILPGGKIVMQGSDKTLVFKTNSNLIVMEGGKVEGEGSLSFSNNGYLYNKGVVEIQKDFVMQSNSGIYNFCTLKIGEKLDGDAANSIFYQEKGAVTAKNIVFNNQSIYLVNGSMIKATQKLDAMSHTSYYAEGENASLVKSPVIEFSSSILYSGKMVIEADSHPSGNEWWSPYELKNGASMAKYDQSEVVIETCDGTGNSGNPGDVPENPKYPIIIDTTGDDYIFAMEDSWPSYGDYDMNDIVVRLSKNNITLYADGSKAVTYQVQVVASGATLPIAAAIQFDKVASTQIDEATYSNTDAINGFKLNSRHTEENQTQAVIPFFANAKEFNGLNSNYINVGDAGITADVSQLPTQEVTIRFAASVKDEDINMKNINFFTMINGTGEARKEIHLAGYEPTDLSGMELFGTADDNSTEGSFKYLSKNSNLPWALVIPTGTWKCPGERVNILNTYPDFKNWATSGGTENKDWYKQL